MSQTITKSDSPDHSLLYHEFRWAIAWGWSTIGIFSILSALTSQNQISPWQIYFSIALALTLLLSFLLHRKFNSALSYVPVPFFLWFSPFFMTNANQKPWVSIGLITVATIVSITNIERLRIVIPLILLSIALQQLIAIQDLPSITDSNDLLLLNGYFGITWCLLVGFGLIYIRQGYLSYHDSIDRQLANVYENQLVQNKSVLSINTADYRNMQLHGTVLNTLIYARDHLKFNLAPERRRLASLIQKDIQSLKSELLPEESFETRLRSMINQIGNRDLDVWLTPLIEMAIGNDTEAQLIEIVREKILNLKKHSAAQNCEVTISVLPIKLQGISFIRPSQYLLVIKFKDDAPIQSKDSQEQHDGAKNSKSMNRLLGPLNAKESFKLEQKYLSHKIEIPLINFQPNAVEQLFELRRRSQEFIARSYVLISMFYGAICLPALLRVGVPTSILLLSTVIVLASIASIVVPKYNFLIVIINSFLALLPLLLAVSSSPVCKNLQYLPWIYNGLIGPVFFATLVISNKFIRWLPPTLFLCVSIFAENQLPFDCESLLVGSTPGIVVLSLLAFLVINIRNRSTKKDLALVQQYRRDASQHVETKVRIQQEQEEILELLAKFAATAPLSKKSVEELKTELNLHILQIRALLVATEYFDSKLVQSIYFAVKQRLLNKEFIELHILTDSFNRFENQDSYAQIEKLLKSRNGNQRLRVSVTSADKTEIRVGKVDGKASPRIFFEDKEVRLLRS